MRGGVFSIFDFGFSIQDRPDECASRVGEPRGVSPRVGGNRDFRFWILSAGQVRGFSRGTGVGGGSVEGEYQCVVGVQW